jgi:hypothetical protein
MAIDSSMLQLYGKPIFTIDGMDDDLSASGAYGAFTTNGFEFQATVNGAQNQDSPVQILIQPQ